MKKREKLASYTKKDFRVDTMCAGGPGGQHQNKTQTAVRITHIETGLSAESREFKSQLQNKKSAFRKLGEKIKLYWEDKIKQNTVKEINDEIIRTYHEQDNRVKDHSSGYVETYTEVDKNITNMINSRRKKMIEDETK